jgi:hypothetical protein
MPELWLRPLSIDPAVLLALVPSRAVEPCRLVIRDEETWRDLWDRLRIERRFPIPGVPAPPVDFAREMVLVAWDGWTQPALALHIVGAAADGETIHVRVQPGAQRAAALADGMAAPLAIVRAPRDERPVNFVDVAAVPTAMPLDVITANDARPLALRAVATEPAALAVMAHATYVTGPERLVVRDDAAWRALWDRLATDAATGVPRAPRPVVDFAGEMLLFATDGPALAGSTIAIASAELRGGWITVDIHRSAPSPRYGPLAVLTPVALVRAPADAHPVLFRSVRP